MIETETETEEKITREIITYVEFFYTVAQPPKNKKRLVDNRDILLLRIPKEAYGFRFYDFEVEVSEDLTSQRSDEKNPSPTYILAKEGQIIPASELTRYPSKFGAAAHEITSDVTAAGAVKTRVGNWVRYGEGTVILDPETRLELWPNRSDDIPKPHASRASRQPKPRHVPGLPRGTTIIP